MSAPEDFAEFHDERLLSAHRRLATCMLALGRAERALRLIADGGYGDASVKARLALSSEDATRSSSRTERGQS